MRVFVGGRGFGFGVSIVLFHCDHHRTRLSAVFKQRGQQIEEVVIVMENHGSLLKLDKSHHYLAYSFYNFYGFYDSLKTKFFV